MEWYGPLTILPAIGMFILATANYLIALNDEIYTLEKEIKNKWVIHQKLQQLKRLGRANALLYASALLFLFSALSKVFFSDDFMFKLFMVIATLIIAVALSILFIHSLKAITIRNKTLEL